MLNPTRTMAALIAHLTDGESVQAEHQHALINDGRALQLLHTFSSRMTQDAIEGASQRGDDVGTAMVVGVESATVAVMLLGIEYGRMVERDQARSLEDLLTDFPEGGS